LYTNEKISYSFAFFNGYMLSIGKKELQTLAKGLEQNA